MSRALRVGLFVGPVAASVGVAIFLGHVLPSPTHLATGLLWTATIVGASLATLVAAERAARQLLPLAALLDLSLTFPDKAPARFAITRRTGRLSDLRKQLEHSQEVGKDGAAEQMQKVIELVLALSVHDKASRGHSERVRVFTDLLADELKIPESGRNRLRWAALLHDIGKLEVPRGILTKAGPPTDAEWSVLHEHPLEGARLVAPLLPWLGKWGAAVAQHHEHFDGTGYPRGLKGRRISLAARIVAVADTYEVMTAPRPYRRPLSVVAARQELVRVAGTQLDPVIVRAFLNVSVGRLWRTIGIGAWMAQLPTIARLFSFGGVGGASASGAGMGLASAAAVAVLGVSGWVGPASPALTTTGGGSQATALAPGSGGQHTPAGRSSQSPLATSPSSTGSPGETAGGTPLAHTTRRADVSDDPATDADTDTATDRDADAAADPDAHASTDGDADAAADPDADAPANPHANTPADADPTADPQPDPRSMELPGLHQHLAQLHQLLQRHPEQVLHPLLRGPEQPGVHLALRRRRQQPALCRLLRRHVATVCVVLQGRSRPGLDRVRPARGAEAAHATAASRNCAGARRPAARCRRRHHRAPARRQSVSALIGWPTG